MRILVTWFHCCFKSFCRARRFHQWTYNNGVILVPTASIYKLLYTAGESCTSLLTRLQFQFPLSATSDLLKRFTFANNSCMSANAYWSVELGLSCAYQFGGRALLRVFIKKSLFWNLHAASVTVWWLKTCQDGMYVFCIASIQGLDTSFSHSLLLESKQKINCSVTS